MMQNFLNVIIFSLVLAFPTTVTAQNLIEQDTVLISRFDSIAEITVNTTLFQHKVKAAPGAISIIDNQSLIQNNSSGVNEALNFATGIFVHNGSLNTSRITIRGIGSRTPYSTNRISAYLDDFPLTDGNGSTILEDIDPSNIQQIEILKGPSSALYGNSLAGTIKLITKKRTSEQYKFSTFLGSFKRFKLYGAINKQLNKNNSISGNIAHFQSDGFRQNNRYQRTTILAGYRYNGNRIKLNILLNGINLNAQIPSSLNYETYQNSPQLAASNWLNVKGFEKYSKAQLGINLQHLVKDNFSFNYQLTSTMYDGYESRPFNILDDQSKSLHLKTFSKYQAKRFSSISGIKLHGEQYSFTIFETNEGTAGDKQNAYKHNNQHLNFFNNIQYQPTKKSTIEAGLNINKTWYQLTEIDQSSQSNHAYPVIFSPRISFNHEIDSRVNWHGTASHGFSTPSYEEALMPEGTINTQLKPEQGWLFETGFKGIFHPQITYDIAFYYMQMNNLLITKRLSEDQFMGINAGKTSHYGLETGITWIPFKHNTKNIAPLSIQTNFSTSRNQFVEFVSDDISFQGKNLPGIPNYSFSGILTWKPHKKTDITLHYQRYGKQFLNDHNTGSYNGHQLLGMSLSYQFIDNRNFNTKLSINLNNITNEQYASMILVNAKSFGGNAPRYYYPGMPLNIWVKLAIGIK